MEIRNIVPEVNLILWKEECGSCEESQFVDELRGQKKKEQYLSSGPEHLPIYYYR